jgi:hypothetical protein
VGATPPKSLYKTPSPLLNILGVKKLLLYTTYVRPGAPLPTPGKSKDSSMRYLKPDNLPSPAASSESGSIMILLR